MQKKNGETRKTRATTPAKWKHFFVRHKVGVSSLRFWSRRRRFVLTRWAQNLSQSGTVCARARARTDISKRTFEPFRCRRELTWHGELCHRRQREILSWKLNPQFKCLSLPTQRYFLFSKCERVFPSLRFSREDYHSANAFAFRNRCDYRRTLRPTVIPVLTSMNLVVEFQLFRAAMVWVQIRANSWNMHYWKTWVRQLELNLHRSRYSLTIFKCNL